MIRKITIILIMFAMLLGCVSCSVAMKNMSTMSSYKDPQTIGGYWTVTMQTGQTFNHVQCTYWGTDDDTAVFKMDDGTTICQSGAVVCIKEK